MKKMIICLLALVVCSTMEAQRLVAFKGYGTNWDKSMVSSKNKPNGYIYRLREDVQCKDLPKVSAAEDHELFIAEPIDMGWLALYRLPLASDDYDFVVVLYNHEKQPVETVNLGYVTDNHYCEVQDVRWDSDNQCILFNMACPSYASQIDGKGSKLYSYSIKDKRIAWETDYLVSNDIFTLNDKYVFCSYGFTSEKKFLFMLDKKTGKQYSKIPMVYKVEYMELQKKGNVDKLFVVDYNENLYEYNVVNTPAPARKK